MQFAAPTLDLRLSQWLAGLSVRADAVRDPFDALGVCAVGDLRDLDEDDVRAVCAPLKKLEAKRFRRGLAALALPNSAATADDAKEAAAQRAARGRAEAEHLRMQQKLRKYERKRDEQKKDQRQHSNSASTLMAPFLYASLELQKGCSAEAIKGAFQRLSRIHHPDKQKQRVRSTTFSNIVVAKDDDAGARFQEIKAAFDILSNPETRVVYDAEGQPGLDRLKLREFQRRQQQQANQQQCGNDCVSVVTRMRAAVADPAVGEAGCRQLALVAKRDGEQGKLAVASSGGMSAAIVCLERHGASHVWAAESGCAVLLVLAEHDGIAAAAVAAGAIPALVAVLRAHGESYPVIAERACGALRLLAFDAGHTRAIKTAGGIEVVSVVLHAHGKTIAGLAKSCCALLEFLALNDSASKQAIMAAGGDKVVESVMAAHLADAVLQQWGAETLRALGRIQ